MELLMNQTTAFSPEYAILIWLKHSICVFNGSWRMHTTVSSTTWICIWLHYCWQTLFKLSISLYLFRNYVALWVLLSSNTTEYNKQKQSQYVAWNFESSENMGTLKYFMNWKEIKIYKSKHAGCFSNPINFCYF